MPIYGVYRRQWVKEWGPVIVVGIVVGMILFHLIPEFASFPEELHVQTASALPILRLLFVIAGLLWMWAGVLHVCYKVGIDVDNALTSYQHYPERLLKLPCGAFNPTPFDRCVRSTSPTRQFSPSPCSAQASPVVDRSAFPLPPPAATTSVTNYGSTLSHVSDTVPRSKSFLDPHAGAHPDAYYVYGAMGGDLDLPAPEDAEDECADCDANCGTAHKRGGYCPSDVSYLAAWVTCFVLIVYLVHSEITVAQVHSTHTTTLAILAFLRSLVSSTALNLTNYIIPVVDPVPLLLLLSLVIALILPFHVLLPHARWALLSNILDVVISPFGRVRFADTFFADQLTSLSGSIADLIYTTCFYEAAVWHKVEPVEYQTLESAGPHATCNNFTFEMKYPLVVLPYIWRFLQCMRLHLANPDAESVKFPAFLWLYPVSRALARIRCIPPSIAVARLAFVRIPLKVNMANAFKYLAFVFVQWTAWLYASGYIRKEILMLISTTAQLYALFWDIFFDWGFERAARRKRAQLALDMGLGAHDDELTAYGRWDDLDIHKRRLLIPRLGERLKWAPYIAAIVIDAILRNVFVLTSAGGSLVPANLLRDETLATFMIVAEIFRRNMWNIFRLDEADVLRIQ